MGQRFLESLNPCDKQSSRNPNAYCGLDDVEELESIRTIISEISDDNRTHTSLFQLQYKWDMFANS